MARIRKLQSKTKTKQKKASSKAKQNPIFKLLGAIGNTIIKVVKKIFRPFRFLLKPFKTKPARFIGRLISKIFFLKYFVASWRELRQVTWPNRKQTAQLTLAVFVFAIILGTFIAITDFGLSKLFERILL
jgi:preprotein translocase SecE subunit